MYFWINSHVRFSTYLFRNLWSSNKTYYAGTNIIPMHFWLHDGLENLFPCCHQQLTKTKECQNWEKLNNHLIRGSRRFWNGWLENYKSFKKIRFQSTTQYVLFPVHIQFILCFLLFYLNVCLYLLTKHVLCITEFYCVNWRFDELYFIPIFFLQRINF